jgi:hypothetical protein
VRRWNFAFQQGFAKARRYSSWSFSRQDAEKRATRRHPGKGALENTNGHASIEQVAHHESGEGAARGEIGAQQDTRGIEAGRGQNALEKRRRRMHHRD